MVRNPGHQNYDPNFGPGLLFVVKENFSVSLGE
jgi:hypothetical protein